MKWQNSANLTATLVHLSDVSSALDSTPVPRSPIDGFHNTRVQLVQLATIQNLETYSYLGQLIVLGITSATENYFRKIFSAIIEMCEIARSNTAELDIPYSAAEWYRLHSVARALFDKVSFSNVQEIEKWSTKYCRMDHSSRSGIKDYFSEFEKVCHLRHSIAHASGFVVGRNAIALGLDSTETVGQFKPSLEMIHECIAICSNLVSAYNQLAFTQMIFRWAKQWKKRPTWDWEQDKERFSKIFSAFHCAQDANLDRFSGYKNSYQCYRSVKSAISAEVDENAT